MCRPLLCCSCWSLPPGPKPEPCLSFPAMVTATTSTGSPFGQGPLPPLDAHSCLSFPCCTSPDLHHGRYARDASPTKSCMIHPSHQGAFPTAEAGTIGQRKPGRRGEGWSSGAGAFIWAPECISWVVGASGPVCLGLIRPTTRHLLIYTPLARGPACGGNVDGSRPAGRLQQLL